MADLSTPNAIRAASCYVQVLQAQLHAGLALDVAQQRDVLRLAATALTLAGTACARSLLDDDEERGPIPPWLAELQGSPWPPIPGLPKETEE